LASVDKHAPEERARLEVAARYYLAYWRMMRGETGLAKKGFAWLWENAPYTSLSRTAARAELMRRER
jgi:hypothetical protein